MAKKSTSKKVAVSRGRVPQAVVGKKVLASGKLGKETKFESVRKAAMKVAPEGTSIKTVISNINHAIRHDRCVNPTAYGYKWSR